MRRPGPAELCGEAVKVPRGSALPVFQRLEHCGLLVSRWSRPAASKRGRRL